MNQHSGERWNRVVGKGGAGQWGRLGQDNREGGTREVRNGEARQL